MTTLTLFKALIEMLVVILVCYGIYREKSLVRFERRAFKFLKCFFKALYITADEKFGKASAKRTASITHLSADSEKSQSFCGSVKKDEIRIA